MYQVRGEKFALLKLPPFKQAQPTEMEERCKTGQVRYNFQYNAVQ